MQMNRGRVLRLAICATLLITTLVIATLRAKHFWGTDEVPLSRAEGKPQLQPEAPPDNVHLKTVSLPGTASRHLLDGDFTIVDRVEGITEGCRDVFEGSFVALSGSAVPSTRVEIVNPGPEFETTDVIRGGLPLRRLEFAGLNKDRCFLFYEHGGAMYPRFCLAVMNTTTRKVLWVGEASKKAHGLLQVRQMLLKGGFNGQPKPAF
jgi:hypothetical protein